MNAVRALLLLVAVGALGAAGWFYYKSGKEYTEAESVLAGRWKVWQGTGAIDVPKLMEAIPPLKAPKYKPTVDPANTTPFLEEFGPYLKRTHELSTQASLVLVGVGVVTLIAGVMAKPAKPAA